jgi:hypothetical protein
MLGAKKTRESTPKLKEKVIVPIQTLLFVDVVA